MADLKVIAIGGTQISETLLRVDDTSGQVTLNSALPVNPDHAASKEYVDQLIAGTASTSSVATDLAQKADASTVVTLTAEVALKATAINLATTDTTVSTIQATLTTLPNAGDLTTVQGDIIALQNTMTGYATSKADQTDLATLQVTVAAQAAQIADLITRMIAEEARP